MTKRHAETYAAVIRDIWTDDMISDGSAVRGHVESGVVNDKVLWVRIVEQPFRPDGVVVGGQFPLNALPPPKAFEAVARAIDEWVAELRKDFQRRVGESDEDLTALD